MDGRESGGFSGDLGGAGALARSPRRITSRGARLRSPSFQLRGAGARSRSPSTVYPRGARPRSPMTRTWNATVHCTLAFSASRNRTTVRAQIIYVRSRTGDDPVKFTHV